MRQNIIKSDWNRVRPCEKRELSFVSHKKGRIYIGIFKQNAEENGIDLRRRGNSGWEKEAKPQRTS
jgi:hypothetical protein